MYYPVQMESVLKDSWSWKLKIEYYFSSAWVVDVIIFRGSLQEEQTAGKPASRSTSLPVALFTYATTKGWGWRKGFKTYVSLYGLANSCWWKLDYISHIGSCVTYAIELVSLHKPGQERHGSAIRILTFVLEVLPKSWRKFGSATERYLEELEDVLTISSSVEVD